MRYDDGIPEMTVPEWDAMIATREAAKWEHLRRMLRSDLGYARCGRVARQVIDLETGDVYPNYRDAAKALCVREASVQTAISQETHVRGRWLAYGATELRTVKGRRKELARRKAAFLAKCRRRPLMVKAGAA